MIFQLKTKDGSKIVKMQEWFYDAYNHVNNQHRDAFTQKHQSSEGRYDPNNTDFQGRYVMQSTPQFTYEVCFKNTGAEVGELHYDPKMPTFCNKNCVPFLDRFGRKDLAGDVNANNANNCVRVFKEADRVYKVSKLGYLTKNLKDILEKGNLIIAIQEISGGIGHMAPVVDVVNGIIIVYNIGDLRRTGLMEISRKAFVADLSDIDFYEIHR